MMNRVHSLLLCGLLASCVTSGRNFSFDDARKIKLGMTAEQVLEIMGPPTNKSIDLSGELWMWIYVDWNMDSKSFAVQLKDDAVVHIIE